MQMCVYKGRRESPKCILLRLPLLLPREIYSLDIRDNIYILYGLKPSYGQSKNCKIP